MTRWTHLLPSHFRFSVRDSAEKKDTVEVFRCASGHLQNSGRAVKVNPLTRTNMDKITAIISQLRIQPEPAIEYITNHFVDIHRSSGRSHVVGAILTNKETQGDHFELDIAAREGLSNKMANCDRTNAAANRLLTLTDIKDPVLYYWTAEGNHNTCLIGDPRMAKYGEDNTVVLDAYPVFPMPHTLAEAAWHMQIPAENEAGHKDLEIWQAQNNMDHRFKAAPLPPPVSKQQQSTWLKHRGWSGKFGKDIVDAWYHAEISDTGQVPDRWSSLFSCKDPSVSYYSDQTDKRSWNQFPSEFFRQRVEAYLRLDKEYPESSSSASMADEEMSISGRHSAQLAEISSIAEDTDMPDVGASTRLSLHRQAGMTLKHITPMQTIVTDTHTGEVLMEIKGSQIPVERVNHGFPVKDPQKPYAIHFDFVSSTDPFRCHKNVKIKKVELPLYTMKVMQSYFPQAAAEPDYFAKRLAEIRAEYEFPLNGEKPPSATKWLPKRLSADECYNPQQARALEGQFGVIPVDHRQQNVGGMGPAFAGAMIKTSAQRRQYIEQTSKAAYDDFAMRVGDPRKSKDVAHFAPYGGGNLAQFLNGQMSSEEPVHFIAVDIMVYLTNKYGEDRCIKAPHFFQIAEVPEGKQAILDYDHQCGKDYFYRNTLRPGMSLGAEEPIKTEPAEAADLSLLDIAFPSTPGTSNKRTISTSPARQSSKRLQLSSPESESGAITRRFQALTPGLNALSDEDLSSGSADLGSIASDYHPADDNKVIDEFNDGVPSTKYKEAGWDIDDGAEDELTPAEKLEQLRNQFKGSDQEIISRLSDDVWQTAQEKAQEEKLPAGINVRKENNIPRYIIRISVGGKQTNLRGFKVTPERNEHTAKSLIIASKMLADEILGIESDQQRIAKIPAHIWQIAQEKARSNQLPTGVDPEYADGVLASNPGDNKPVRYRPRLPGIPMKSFAVTRDRDDFTAKSLAIATRILAEKRAGVSGTRAKKKSRKH